MQSLMHNLARILTIVGLITLILAIVVKVGGVDFLAVSQGWLRFATACGILALAGRFCWTPTEEGATS